MATAYYFELKLSPDKLECILFPKWSMLYRALMAHVHERYVFALTEEIYSYSAI